MSSANPERVFWRLIRGARERRGLGQGEVPGIPQSRFSEWESGRVSISEDTLIKVAAALGTTVREMLLEELSAEARPGPAKARPKKSTAGS